MKQLILFLLTIQLVTFSPQSHAGIGSLFQRIKAFFVSSDEAGKIKKVKTTKRAKPKLEVTGDGAVKWDGGDIIGSSATRAVKPNGKIKGRRMVIRQINRAFQVTGSLPVLLGPAGGGKSVTANYLAYLVEKHPERVPYLIHPKKHEILEFNVNEFLKDMGIVGTDSAKISKLIQELKERDDLVLVFDEFSELMDKPNGKALVTALKTSIANGELKSKVIFNMQQEQYTKYMRDPGIIRRTVAIAVDEPTDAVVRQIIEADAFEAQAIHGVTVDQVIVEKILMLSKKLPKDSQADANPAYARKLFDYVVQTTVQERVTRSTYVEQMEDTLEAIQTDLSAMQRGLEEGVPMYKGPFFRQKRKKLEKLEKEYIATLTKYNDDFHRTQEDRNQLIKLIKDRADKMKLRDQAIEDGTDGTKISEISYAMEVLDEQIEVIGARIAEVNSLLVVSKVDDSHVVEGVAAATKRTSKQIEQFLESARDADFDKVIQELEQKISGQRSAIEAVVTRIMTNRSGFDMEEGMLGFLLLGPSTVGKTYLANLLAERFTFGQKYTMAMGDIAKDAGLSDHIGQRKGIVGGDELGPLYVKAEETKGLMTLIVDEPDKGPDQIYAFLMEMLREGKSTSKGTLNKEYDFSKALAIVASNAVEEITPEVQEQLARATTDTKRQLILKAYVQKYAQLNGVNYPAGFLNRLYIVFMNNLESEHIREVARIRLSNKGYFNKIAEGKNFGIEFDDSVIDYVTQQALSENGSVKGVQQIIDLDIAPKLLKMYSRKEMIEGDIVKIKIRKNDLGDMELVAARVPWQNAQESIAKEWDYSTFVRVRDLYVQRMKRIAKDLETEEFARDFGLPKGVVLSFEDFDFTKFQDLLPYYVDDIKRLETFMAENLEIDILVEKLAKENLAENQVIKVVVDADKAANGVVDEIHLSAVAEKSLQTKQAKVNANGEALPRDTVEVRHSTGPDMHPENWKLLDSQDLYENKRIYTGGDDALREETLEWIKISDIEDRNKNLKELLEEAKEQGY